jgi:hypothetical protein
MRNLFRAIEPTRRRFYELWKLLSLCTGIRKFSAGSPLRAARCDVRRADMEGGARADRVSEGM